MYVNRKINLDALTSAGLAQLVECLTTEWKVVGSLGRTNTQGLKITEKWNRMVVPSPVGDIKIVSPNSTSRAKYLDTQIKCCFLYLMEVH